MNTELQYRGGGSERRRDVAKVVGHVRVLVISIDQVEWRAEELGGLGDGLKRQNADLEDRESAERTTQYSLASPYSRTQLSGPSGRTIS